MDTLSEHANKTFNNKTFSDFQIRSGDGGVIYVHKVLMCRCLYFKTLFATGVGSKVEFITVLDIDIARILVHYIYSQHLDVVGLGKVISGDFSKFDIAYGMFGMWTVGKNCEYLRIYAENHKEKFIGDNINNLFTLKSYFKDFKVEDSVIKKNAHQITKKHIEEGLLVDYYRFNRKWIFPIMVKCKSYDLLLINSQYLSVDFIFEHFKPSLRQISFLKRGTVCKDFLHPFYLSPPRTSNIFITITSFEPFQIVVYKKIGKVEGKSKKHRSIFVTPSSSFSKTDCLSVGGKVYPIHLIYHKEKEQNKACKSIEYSVALKWGTKDTLPDKGTPIYKVIEI